MLYSFKKHFQKFANFFLVSGLTANQATFLGSFFCITIVSCFYFSLSNNLSLLLIPFLMLFKMIANALDGIIARQKNTASAAGELMNEVLDVFGDTFMFGALALYQSTSIVLLCILLVLIWSGEFVGVMGRALPGQARRHESFGGGKSERAVWISLLALALYFYPPTIQYLNIFFVLMSILVLLTAYLRYRKILQITKAKEHEYVSFTAHGR